MDKEESIRYADINCNETTKPNGKSILFIRQSISFIIYRRRRRNQDDLKY